MLIVELKSEALKERHWKQLMRRLRVNWILTDLTLGKIWDADLQKNENIVKDVINVAQGEMALEEFLKQVCCYPFVTYMFATCSFGRCIHAVGLHCCLHAVCQLYPRGNSIRQMFYVTEFTIKTSLCFIPANISILF